MTVEVGERHPSGPRGGKAGAGITELLEGKMAGTSKPIETVSTKLHQIAMLARQMPTAVLTTLGHNIDVDWLTEAYKRTRKDGATGVDGQTAAEYAERLDEHLTDLLERVRTQRYVAPPVRRVNIPKEGAPGGDRGHVGSLFVLTMFSLTSERCCRSIAW